MFKRGELAKLTVVITLVILAAFLFLGAKPFENGPTGMTALGPVWVGETTRFVVPMNEQLALSLDDYFTSEEQLTYVATRTDKIDVRIEGSVLILIPDDDFIGERIITVYAFDGGAITRQRIRITVATSAESFTPTVAEPKKIKVEQAIEDALAVGNEVSAIIILKESAPFTFSANAAPKIKEQLLEQRRKQVELAKEALLNKVNEKPPGITGAVATEFDFELVREYETVNALAVKLTRSGLANLRNDPAVEQILLDRPFSTFRAESIPLIDADDVWNMDVNGTNITGAGETICIVDTGIDMNHSAFTNKIIGGYDFVNEDNLSQDDATNSHGTHVAGIAAGNGTVKGVAPDVNIVAVKSCNSAGSCTGSDMLAGIDYCNNNSVLFNITVISSSVGDSSEGNSTNCPTLFFSALNTSVSLGIIPVFASGNGGKTGGISYPACSPFTISAGSTSKSDVVDSFSNRGGDRMDVFAPGSSITSSVIGGGTGVLSGTSMATPHVAGAIVLLQQSQKLQNKSILSIYEMRQLLIETGKQVDEWHRIDVHAAIVKLDQNYTINLTDNSVTNITPPKAKIKFKNDTDFSRFIECSKIRHNFVDIDSAQCPEYNKSAHIVLEGLAGVNATPLRNNQPCPPDICQNVTFVNGTLEFDVTEFTNYSGNSSFNTGATVSGCAVINESTDLTSDVQSNVTCMTINASNIFLNCSGFSITFGVNGTNLTSAITATNKTNITIQDCVIEDANESGSFSMGIHFIGVNDSRIVNNTIQTNGTGQNNHDIKLSDISDRNVIANNTLRALGIGSDNYGIALLNSDYTNVTGNTIFTNGSFGNYGMIINESGTNNTISYNIIFTNSSNNQSNTESANHGIDIESGTNNVTFNNISTDGFGGFNVGVVLFLVNGHDVLSNFITTNGGLGTNLGISFTVASHNRVFSNIIQTSSVAGSTNDALFAAAGATNNTVSHNNLSVSPADSFMISLNNADLSVYTNNTLTNPGDWIESLATSAGNNYTNTTFISGNGSIFFNGTFTLAGLTNITRQKLNITSNVAFLNSTNLTALNQSARITLFGVTSGDPKALIDLEDDGLFSECPASICTKDSFANNNFVFNVTHFTGYSSNETPLFNFSNITVTKIGTPDPVENSSQLNYTITIVSVGNGTAYNVTVNETYPAEVIFNTAEPTPLTGTNTTFILGNLTNGTVLVINITVNVTDILNGTLINNTINVTFQNETSDTQRIDVAANNTVENITITPPPPVAGSTGGSSSGGGGGGGGVSRKKEEPQAPIIPTPLAMPRSSIITQKEVPAAVEAPAEIQEPELEAVEEIIEPEIKTRNIRRIMTLIFYTLAMLAIFVLCVYWFVLHHKQLRRK